MERLQVIESRVEWKRDYDNRIDRLRDIDDFESHIKMLVLEKERDMRIDEVIKRHEWLLNINQPHL